MKTRHIQTATNPAVLAGKLFKLERCGKYSEALNELADIWPNTEVSPDVNSFDEHDRAEILLRCGSLMGFHGHNTQIADAQLRAKDLLSNARERFLILEMIEKAAECEVHLALTFWRTGEYNEAENWVAEALGHDLPDSSDTRLYSCVTQTLIDVDRKRYREIVDFAEQIESDLRKYGDAFLLGSFYSNLAISHKNLGNLTQALSYYELAKYYHERSRHKTYLSIVENNLAHLYLVTGQFLKAHSSIENAAKIFRQLKDKTREGYALDTKAAIYLAECKYADALQTVERALTILKKSENSAYLVDTLLTKSKILLRLDNFSDAVVCLIDAVNIAKVQAGNVAVKRLISEFETALNAKSEPPKKTLDDGDFELILPQSIGHYDDYRGVWINNTRLEDIGLGKGSLAIVVKAKIDRGDLIALVELETNEVSCGFYDSEFGIVCVEGTSGEPQIFDETAVRVLGKIVGVCNSSKDKDGKMAVESLDLKV
ncbi:MAG: tetratricopeptide repeat protein [Pyrinomonadaceae bacterium]